MCLAMLHLKWNYFTHQISQNTLTSTAHDLKLDIETNLENVLACLTIVALHH